MKDEFDAEKLGRVGSGQLTGAMSLKRTVQWHEQEMCFSHVHQTDGPFS